MVGGRPDAVSSLLQRGAIYTLATAAQVLAGVLVLPALTRLWRRTQPGIVALALLVQSVAGVLAALGLPASIMRTYFREEGPDQARAVVARTVIAAAMIAVFAEPSFDLWAPLVGAEGFEGRRLAVAWPPEWRSSPRSSPCFAPRISPTAT